MPLPWKKVEKGIVEDGQPAPRAEVTRPIDFYEPKTYIRLSREGENIGIVPGHWAPPLETWTTIIDPGDLPPWDVPNLPPGAFLPNPDGLMWLNVKVKEVGYESCQVTVVVVELPPK